jgi:hypothetical protein
MGKSEALLRSNETVIAINTNCGHDSDMRRQTRTRDTIPSTQPKKPRNTQTSLRWRAGLSEQDKRTIDAAFRPMEKDAAYRREALQLVKDFSASDHECLVHSAARRR